LRLPKNGDSRWISSKLPKQRRHGITYTSINKTSGDLLDEELKINGDGALPLYYETITGNRAQETAIRIGDVYPFISGISAEYEQVTGQHLAVVAVSDWGTHTDGVNHVARLRFDSLRDPPEPVPSQIPLAPTFREQGPNHVFAGPPFSTASLAGDLRSQILEHLLYQPRNEHDERALTPSRDAQGLQMFEELPIALMFFHLGSVVRYKPDYLDELRQTKYWPIVAIAQRHAVLGFLTLFWEYMHKEMLFVDRQ
jgi:hypothetical protein